MKTQNDNGLSFLIVIGRNGGIHVSLSKSSIHLCLCFISFTIFFSDLEYKLSRILGKYLESTKKGKNLNT